MKELFPRPGDQDFLGRAANDPAFALHRQATRGVATTEAEFRAESAAACPNGERDFELSLQQSFLQFMMGHLTPYRSLLLFHRPGAGKTCTAITIALDHLRHVQGSGAGKVLVIASDVLQGNFRTQVFDDTLALTRDGLRGQCTRDEYLRMVPDAGTLRPDELRGRIRKIIRSQFTMLGYDRLAATLERLSDAEIARSYSDKVIVVDEAHNLRPSSRDNKRASVQMARLARCGRRNRLLLMTATPMFNADSEIVYMMNLCLENDGRPPLPAGGGPEEVGAASVGYVSYAMADDPLMFPARVAAPGGLASYGGSRRFLDFAGAPMASPWRFSDGFSVVACPFRDEQLRAYAAVRAASVKDDDDDVVDAADSDDVLFSAIIRTTANVAFPSGSPSEPKKYSGHAGFAASFLGTPWQGGLRYAPSRAGEFLAPDRLPRWSAKLARMVANLEAVREGPVLAFSDFLYAGVLPLAVALEHRGWVREGGPPLLESEARRPPGKKRYVLLVGDHRFTPDLGAAVAAVNRADPADGVLAVLFTRVASEGVNFRGIREVHVMEPWYNMAKIEQVVGRAVRTCRHAHLPPEKRNVTVYHYAGTLPTRESSDLYMWRLSDTKRQQIARVEDALRVNAVDCTLFASAARAVDPSLRIRMVDARGRAFTWRVGGRTQRPHRCRVGHAKPSGPPEAPPPALFDHLVPRAEREVEAIVAEHGPGTLTDVLRRTSGFPHDIYFDAIGRLLAAQRVRFDDGKYSLLQPPPTTPLVRHELVPPSMLNSRTSIVSPDSPDEPVTAWAAAVTRLSGSDALEYDVLTLRREELAGAALRFLVRGGALTPAEARIRALLEKHGVLKDDYWIDHHALPRPAVFQRSRSGTLEPCPPPPGMFEAVRALARARILEWRADKQTYGMLSVYRPRKGAGDTGEIVLKLVRPVGGDEYHSGFVCTQTSQFRVQDMRDAIQQESGKPTSSTSKTVLCHALGAALLKNGRLLGPLQAELTHADT